MTTSPSKSPHWPPNIVAAAETLATHARPISAATGDPDLSRRVEKSSDFIGILFARYSRLVFGIAYRVLEDANEAEDVVQEVFLYLHLKSQLFDPSRGSAKSWIVQIAFSRALDRKTYLARRRFYSTADIECLPPLQTADFERKVEAKLNRKHLEKAFSELSSMQRRTIESFYFEGLDLRAISERLREPLGSVRHHLYRGLERLRKSSVLDGLRS